MSKKRRKFTDATNTAGFSKKKLGKVGTLERKKMIEVKADSLPIKEQCSLLDISRSGYYYIYFHKSTNHPKS